MSRNQSSKVECVCGTCGKRFSAKSSAVARGGGKYCSQPCYHVVADARPKYMVDRTCQQCGKTFQTWPHEIKARKAIVCSRACTARHKSKPLAIRFAGLIGSPDERGCLPWAGKRDPNGYGRIRADGSRKDLFAHRVAWEIVNGPIPDGMCVLHKCDNPQCVLVDHLFLGTNADNMADKVAKGRQRKGESVHCAKLTEQAVRSIRERYAAGGITQKQLAVEHKISVSQVIGIIKRRYWKHLAH